MGNIVRALDSCVPGGVEESQQRLLCCVVHVWRFWGDSGDDQHVLMVRNIDGLDEGPHEELVWHGGETLLLGLLVGRLEVGYVLLHASILLLRHLHEVTNMLAHICQVVLLEFRVEECHQPVVAGEGVGRDGGLSSLAIGSGNSIVTELFIEVDLEDFVSNP